MRRRGRDQLTVTVAPEMGEYVKMRADQERTTVSAMVERFIGRDKGEYEDQLMKEGYLEMHASPEWPVWDDSK